MIVMWGMSEKNGCYETVSYEVVVTSEQQVQRLDPLHEVQVAVWLLFIVLIGNDVAPLSFMVTFVQTKLIQSFC